MTKLERLLMLIILILVIVVVSGLFYSLYTPQYRFDYRSEGPGPQYPGGVYPFGNQGLKTDFESNGERIYYTGFDETGQRIRTTYGPPWLYMHGGSCVNCHGADGKGGAPVMMGFEIPSDITYETLTSEEHAEEEHEEHPPYTDETIKIAIRDGVDPAGQPLDLTMPRWQMTDEDLDDLIDYLKSL